MAGPQKITFGDMRDSGVRAVLIYCSDYRCSHWIEMIADQWADYVRCPPSSRAIIDERRGSLGSGLPKPSMKVAPAPAGRPDTSKFALVAPLTRTTVLFV